jgi:CheY-like chemotaxis protein
MGDELRHILCVDDDPDILRIAAMSLELVGGLTVTTAGSGAEAIETARRVRPDVIILDVMMPGMDGPATLARIRADPDLAAIPVVLLTARVRGVEVDDYLTAGADGVIAKPFDPMMLAGEISALWRARRR